MKGMELGVGSARCDDRATLINSRLNKVRHAVPVIESGVRCCAASRVLGPGEGMSGFRKFTRIENRLFLCRERHFACAEF